MRDAVGQAGDAALQPMKIQICNDAAHQKAEGGGAAELPPSPGGQHQREANHQIADAIESASVEGVCRSWRRGCDARVSLIVVHLPFMQSKVHEVKLRGESPECRSLPQKSRIENRAVPPAPFSHVYPPRNQKASRRDT